MNDSVLVLTEGSATDLCDRVWGGRRCGRGVNIPGTVTDCIGRLHSPRSTQEVPKKSFERLSRYSSSADRKRMSERVHLLPRGV
jgi:hypothetical protein